MAYILISHIYVISTYYIDILKSAKNININNYHTYVYYHNNLNHANNQYYVTNKYHKKYHKNIILIICVE